MWLDKLKNKSKEFLSDLMDRIYEFFEFTELGDIIITVFIAMIIGLFLFILFS